MNTNKVKRVVINGTTYKKDVMNNLIYDFINHKWVGHYNDDDETPIIWDEIDAHYHFVEFYRKVTPDGCYIAEQGEWDEKEDGRVSEVKIGNQSYFVTSYNVVYDLDCNDIMSPLGIWEPDTETFTKFPELDDHNDDWTNEDWNNNELIEQTSINYELTKQTLINTARYMVLNKMALA